jgi:hypothetical protein
VRNVVNSLIFCLVALVSVNISAAIWHAENEWNSEWEIKYAQWIDSPAVHKDMFVGKSSKYYGIKADCADASYALRAIFSMNNKLPFIVKNPSGSRDGIYKYLSNDTNKFDYAGSQVKRLIAFLNYLGSSVGTEQLSNHDTHPVKLEKIIPGMIFTYKIKGRFGKTIRHSYNIKKVRPTGDTDVIYSTQAIAKKKLPMIQRESYELSNAPHGNWGYKRFKWPQHHFTSVENLPPEFAYSREQFDFAKELSEREFFKYVKKLLATETETPQTIVTKKLKTLCTLANDRIEYVNQGYQHHVATGGKCMNYADYDAYSTPARDKALANAFSNFKAEIEDLTASGDIREVDFVTLEMARAIAFGEYNEQVSEDLYKYCTVEYAQGRKLHLAKLYKLIQAGALSSHPNDGIAQRWGETTSGRTRCRAWY